MAGSVRCPFFLSFSGLPLPLVTDVLGHILQGLRSIFWRKLGGKPCLLLQAVVLSLGPLDKRKNAVPFMINIAQVQKLWLKSETIKLQPSLFVLSPQIRKKQKKMTQKHPIQKKHMFSYKSHFIGNGYFRTPFFRLLEAATPQPSSNPKTAPSEVAFCKASPKHTSHFKVDPANLGGRSSRSIPAPNFLPRNSHCRALLRGVMTPSKCSLIITYIQ